MQGKTRGGSVKKFRALALEDFKPGTINSCIYVKGQNLRPLVDEMIENICARNRFDEYDLCHEISAQLGTEKSTMLKYFSARRRFPIYLLNILLARLSLRKQEIYRPMIERSIQFFKFGTSETWVKFPKRLNRELAWLVGAVAADGWITKESGGKERLGIVDQNKSALAVAGQNFELVFGYKPRLARHKTQDCYLLIVDCKAIVRFFTTFLGFGYGPKARAISEPPIIKKSHYRLDFAKGVMSFDGSVELDGTVSIGVRSEKLIRDLYDIFKENDLAFKYSAHSGLFFLSSPYLSNCPTGEKWIRIFGLNTTKGNRLNFLINGANRRVTSEAEAIRVLDWFVRKKHNSKLSMKDVLDFAKAKKKFTKYQMMNEFKVAHATFWKYVLVLRRANILASENKFGRGISNHYLFNPKIEDWRVPPTVS